MNEQGKDYEAFIAANKSGDWFNFKAGEAYGREEMEKLLDSAKEVIKFYADQANWWFDEYDAKYSDIALQDIDECGFGGKKAREWLNDNK